MYRILWQNHLVKIQDPKIPRQNKRSRSKISMIHGKTKVHDPWCPRFHEETRIQDPPQDLTTAYNVNVQDPQELTKKKQEPRSARYDSKTNKMQDTNFMKIIHTLHIHNLRNDNLSIPIFFRSLDELDAVLFLEVYQHHLLLQVCLWLNVLHVYMHTCIS